MTAIKKLLTVLFIFSMAAVFTACSGSLDPAEKGMDEMKTYKAAMEPTFPPFDMINETTQELEGLDVDLMNAIAKDQGFRLEWVNMDFDGLIPALQAGSIDIIASGMGVNEDRISKVDFSSTYYDSGLAAAVSASSTRIKTISDLTPDMKAGGQIGTTGAEYITGLYESGKIGEAKIYSGLDVAVADLQNGYIDVLINDIPVTKAYMKEKPGTIRIIGGVLEPEAYGYAVRKGNLELLDKINKGLRNLKASGQFDEICSRWLDE